MATNYGSKRYAACFSNVPMPVFHDCPYRSYWDDRYGKEFPEPFDW